MFRTSLLRQQRSLVQSLSRTQNATLSSYIRFPARTLPALCQQPSRRWQSTETAKAADEPPPSTEAAKEDPVKKELEAKSKEVVDLKVPFPWWPFQAIRTS
jgi:hypothetical protein